MSKDDPSLTSASLDNDRVHLGWSDSRSSAYHPIWLRDNCRCESCGDPAIGRRKLRLTEIDLNSKPQKLEAEPEWLRVTWLDGHRSQYSSRW